MNWTPVSMIAAAMLGVFAVAPASSAEEPISLTITGPSLVKVGTEIKVAVTLKNLSGQPLGITNHQAAGPSQEGPYVEVRDSQGKLAPLREHYRHIQQEGQDGSIPKAVDFSTFVLPGNPPTDSVAADYFAHTTKAILCGLSTAPAPVLYDPGQFSDVMNEVTGVVENHK